VTECLLATVINIEKYKKVMYTRKIYLKTLN